MVQLDFALPADYTIDGFLGSGSFGCVFLVTRPSVDEDGNPTTEQVAIKRVDDYSRRRATCTDEYQLNFTRRIVREVEILYTFKDNYEFVELKDIYVSQDGLDLYIVMPFIENSLQSTLTNPQVYKVGIAEDIVRNVVLQILLGLLRMKKCNVIHRDLTPANILVNAKGNWNCFLADFGLGRVVETIDAKAMTQDVVTLPYRPPEVLMQCPGQDTQVDIWSLGCVMAEMLRGDMFLHRKDHIQQLAAIIMCVCGPPDLESWRGRASEAAVDFLEKNWTKIETCEPTPLEKVVPNASPEALDVLSAMLKFDPADRAMPEQLLEMGWFQDQYCQDEINYAATVDSPSQMHVDVEPMEYEQLIAQIESRATLQTAQSVPVDY